MKFFFTLCESDMILVYSLVKRCLQQSVSNMGKNINMIDVLTHGKPLETNLLACNGILTQTVV